MLKKLRLIGKSAPVDCLNFTSAVKEVNQGGGGELLRSHTFSYAHYVKNQRSTVLRRNKNLAVKGGTVLTIIFWLMS